MMIKQNNYFIEKAIMKMNYKPLENFLTLLLLLIAVKIFAGNVKGLYI